MSTELQKKPSGQLVTMRTMLEQAAPKLAEVAPRHLKPERIIRLLLAAASRNPKILTCTQESVLQFAMTCSQTGLEPIGAGGIYPIPRRNSHTNATELTALPDYRGLINCAKHAGCIKDAYAEVVYEHDQFDYALGLEPYLVHKPARGSRGALESAYCIIVLPDGAKRFVVMDRSEVDSIRRRSQSGGSGPWVTDEGEMWKKTVIRRAMKPFIGAAPELDAAIELDDKATGVVKQHMEIRMPVAVSEPEPVALSEDKPATQAQEPATAPEPLPEGDDAGQQPEQPAGPSLSEWQGKVIGVNKGTGKAPFSVETDGGPRFKTFSAELAKTAQAFAGTDELVNITYREETKGQYTNNMLESIERAG